MTEVLAKSWQKGGAFWKQRNSEKLWGTLGKSEDLWVTQGNSKLLREL